LSRGGFINDGEPFQGYGPHEQAEGLEIKEKGNRVKRTPNEGASQSETNKGEKKQEPLTDFKKSIESHFSFILYSQIYIGIPKK
jgi:hypothetical protein